MKKLMFSFLSLVALLGFAGCKSAVVDSSGAVQPEVASQLTSYEGEYQGSLFTHNPQGLDELAQKNFSLRFTVQGDRPVITTLTDILGKDCNSSVGKLLSITTGGIWKAIAIFEFDPGTCPKIAEGRTVTVYVGDNGAMLTLAKGLNALQVSPSARGETEYRVTLTK